MGQHCGTLLTWYMDSMTQCTRRPRLRSGRAAGSPRSYRVWGLQVFSGHHSPIKLLREFRGVDVGQGLWVFGLVRIGAQVVTPCKILSVCHKLQASRLNKKRSFYKQACPARNPTLINVFLVLGDRSSEASGYVRHTFSI